jgi:hypothetical protein
MTDIQPIEMTGTELAAAIRRECANDIWQEGLARLVEATEKDHNMLAAGEMKWRCLLEEVTEFLDDLVVDGELVPADEAVVVEMAHRMRSELHEIQLA